MIVCAVSEPHARVAAHEYQLREFRDGAWLSDLRSTCDELVPRRAGVVHTLYGPDQTGTTA